MTSIDLAATSSRPRTTGPPTWLTRHGEAGLTQAWRGQRSYDRPNTGKVGKVDITQRQTHLTARTTDDMVRCNGMVSNKEDKGFRYGYPVTRTRVRTSCAHSADTEAQIAPTGQARRFLGNNLD
ncbi:hypothetical protein BHM03_00053367 [Ensete ventricosum]|nr:hypothetical protein BHM03_00053367 [Ensete ventricosum]